MKESIKSSETTHTINKKPFFFHRVKKKSGKSSYVHLISQRKKLKWSKLISHSHKENHEPHELYRAPFTSSYREKLGELREMFFAHGIYWISFQNAQTYLKARIQYEWKTYFYCQMG